MPRTEAIALISARLTSLDDERLQTIAEIVEEQPAPTLRALSEREKSLLEKSREDFRAGRTYTLEEVIEYTNAQLAPLGVRSYKRA